MRGVVSSTCRSWAPRTPSASNDTWMPGAMAPPTYWPAASTTSNVVAVPMSTTMHGAPNRSTAPTTLATRSVPTSRGLSISIGSPDFTPGPDEDV